MAAWTPIIGKGFTAAQFAEYVEGVKLVSWHPKFVVIHNTANPTLLDWHKCSGQQRMHNLEVYYRDQQHWSAGPHLFVADDLIWVFTPLDHPGVHSPSWNHAAWGVELVGNYDLEPWNLKVEANAIVALAALHRLGNLNPGQMRLHREDPLTTHACPGKNVSKADLVQNVIAALEPIPVVDLGGDLEAS